MNLLMSCTDTENTQCEEDSKIGEASKRNKSYKNSNSEVPVIIDCYYDPRELDKHGLQT